MNITDNVMLLKYFYGDDYTYEMPYDVSLEDTMKAIGHLIEFEEAVLQVNKEAYKYGTGLVWTASINTIEGRGLTMLEACYNSLVNYVKEKESKKSQENL